MITHLKNGIPISLANLPREPSICDGKKRMSSFQAARKMTNPSAALCTAHIALGLCLNFVLAISHMMTAIVVPSANHDNTSQTPSPMRAEISPNVVTIPSRRGAAQTCLVVSTVLIG